MSLAHEAEDLKLQDLQDKPRQVDLRIENLDAVPDSLHVIVVEVIVLHSAVDSAALDFVEPVVFMSHLTPWQQAWDQAQPRLLSLRDSLPSSAVPASRILRVGQLDAELLDQELVHILLEPVNKALALIHVCPASCLTLI